MIVKMVLSLVNQLWNSKKESKAATEYAKATWIDNAVDTTPWVENVHDSPFVFWSNN